MTLNCPNLVNLKQSMWQDGEQLMLEVNSNFILWFFSSWLPRTDFFCMKEQLHLQPYSSWMWQLLMGKSAKRFIWREAGSLIRTSKYVQVSLFLIFLSTPCGSRSWKARWAVFGDFFCVRYPGRSQTLVARIEIQLLTTPWVTIFEYMRAYLSAKGAQGGRVRVFKGAGQSAYLKQRNYSGRNIDITYTDCASLPTLQERFAP